MLSIIIPAKNEENYLPKLIDSIKKQDYKDYEIIVADGGSKDRTREIARKYRCRVVVGKKKGSPAIERNKGAKIARGDLLLFLDADIILPEDFLGKLVKEIREKELDVGSCYSMPYDGKAIDKVIVGTSNVLMNMVKKMWPHAYGWCMFSKKKVHKAIDGFNEDIFVGEDHDYARKASKIGKFGIIKDLKTLNSMRRYAKEGRIKLTIKYILLVFYRLFVGELKGHKIKYSFDYKK